MLEPTPNLVRECEHGEPYLMLACHSQAYLPTSRPYVFRVTFSPISSSTLIGSSISSFHSLPQVVIDPDRHSNRSLVCYFSEQALEQ
jgi:hypothetical protein